MLLVFSARADDDLLGDVFFFAETRDDDCLARDLLLGGWVLRVLDLFEPNNHAPIRVSNDDVEEGLGAT